MIGLILEGGGMRCAFTAGVLDFWMEQGLYFQNVYGVSAGACQACSYLCHQKGRGLRVWLKYLNDPRFCSMRSLLKTGDMFNAAFNYDTVPRRLDPLDNEVFLKSGAKLTAVVTDVNTGEPLYMPIRDMFGDIAAIQATASLPLISKAVKCGEKRCLDGGIADSIPIRKAIADGFIKNVAVLTQAPGYRKSPNSAMGLMRARYVRHPQFVKAIAKRHEMYNDTLDFIERETAAGRLFVLRPAVTPDVNRIEKDPDKLRRLHDIGYEAAKEAHSALLDFLGGDKSVSFVPTGEI